MSPKGDILAGLRTAWTRFRSSTMDDCDARCLQCLSCLLQGITSSCSWASSCSPLSQSSYA